MPSFAWHYPELSTELSTGFVDNFLKEKIFGDCLLTVQMRHKNGFLHFFWPVYDWQIRTYALRRN